MRRYGTHHPYLAPGRGQPQSGNAGRGVASPLKEEIASGNVFRIDAAEMASESALLQPHGNEHTQGEACKFPLFLCSGYRTMKAYVVIWPGTGATWFRFSGIVSAQSSSRHGSLIIRKGRTAVNGATGGGAIPGLVAVKDVTGKNPRKGTAKGCGHYQSTTRRQRLLAQRTHTNSLFGNKPRCSSNPVLGLGGIVPAPNLLFGRKPQMFKHNKPL
jgi:hypothetical protein